MTDYRATPDQWAYQEHWAQEDGDAACLLELRDRVQSLEDDSWKQAESTSYCIDALVKRIEALESAQRVIASPSSNRTHLGLTQDAPESSDSLVKRVADAIYNSATGGVREEARAAIHAVADWFEQQGSHTTAARLRQEVGQ